ncbi:MAG: hypothetical protein J6A96_03735 [Clostridia bacterium]|nr:hypothetical protein [Clostridia bacterium]
MNRPKVNWRGGLLYALLLEIEVLVTAFFLTFAIYPARMLFEEGILRELAEILILVLVELVVRFFVFFALFKNNKRLDFPYFIGGYAIALGIRLVFSYITSFAAFSAGMSVLLIGQKLAASFINPEIKTMQEVPKLLYIVVFLLFEGLSILIAYFASKKVTEQREKIRKELHGE